MNAATNFDSAASQYMKQQLGIFWVIFELVLRICRVSLEVVTRRHFGADYLTAPIIATAMFGLPFVLLFFTGSEGSRGLTGQFQWIYAVVVFCFSLVRYAEIKHKDANGIAWYSLGSGISYDFWEKLPILKRSPHLVKTWAEPLAWFIIGFVMSKMVYGFGFMLMVSAVAMWIHEQTIWNAQLRLARSEMNALILQRHSAAAIQGTHPAVINGLHLPAFQMFKGDFKALAEEAFMTEQYLMRRFLKEASQAKSGEIGGSGDQPELKTALESADPQDMQVKYEDLTWIEKIISKANWLLGPSHKATEKAPQDN